MTNFVRIAILAGTLATTMAAPAMADPQCVEVGPAHPYVDVAGVPVSGPSYVDTDPWACLGAVLD